MKKVIGSKTMKQIFFKIPSDGCDFFNVKSSTINLAIVIFYFPDSYVVIYQILDSMNLSENNPLGYC